MRLGTSHIALVEAYSQSVNRRASQRVASPVSGAMSVGATSLEPVYSLKIELQSHEFRQVEIPILPLMLAPPLQSAGLGPWSLGGDPEDPQRRMSTLDSNVAPA